MAADTTQGSRRTILAAAVAGVGAWVASALGRPEPSSATHLGYVQLGHSQSVAEDTSITYTGITNDSGGIRGNATAQSDNVTYGVVGKNWSTNGRAVWGVGLGPTGPSYGVYGETYAPGGVGVYGTADGAGSRGVWGQTTTGQGVRGQATSGIGVRGYVTSGAAGSFEATTGWAIQSSGRVSFGKISGLATIAAGASTVTVTPGVDVSSATFVLLTPRANLGGRSLWYSVNTSANSFTIRVSSNLSGAAAVGWLVVG